jgi:2Fe-2S ferredoxin
MPTITYVEASGRQHRIEVDAGTSVMRGAVDNAVRGIDGDCGGECACATCHVYVAPDWLVRTGGRTSAEEDLLSFVDDVRENSRLACQITVSEVLDGLTVTMPAAQH